MKRLIKAVLYKVAVRFYYWGKEYDQRKSEERRLTALKEVATVDQTAVVYPEASIDNQLKDPSRIKIGKESRILSRLLLLGKRGEIHIGEYVFCGLETRIWSAKKITIGNRVLISHNVNIHDNISHSLNAAARHEDFVHIFSKGYQDDNDLREKEIVIEDDVWIGFNATILKGVTIGRGAIVGANTVITHDVPPFAIVVGNPSRIIKYAD